MTDWRVECYFDGSITRNPGGRMHYGAYASASGKDLWQISLPYHAPHGVIGTNNVAEYAGLIAVLTFLLENGYSEAADIVVRGDSELVISQLNRQYKIGRGHYAYLAYRAREFIQQFAAPPLFEWIPREQNSLADRLSRP